MVCHVVCSFYFSLFLHSFIGLHVPFTALNGTSMTTRQGNGRNIWRHDHVTPTNPSIHCSFCVQRIVGQTVEFSCVLTSKKAGVTFLEHSHISHISLLFSQKNQVNCFPNSTTYNLVAYIFRSFLGLKISSGEKQVWTCVKDRTHDATLRATLRAMGWTHGTIVAWNVAEVELASTPATLRAILHAMLHHVSGPLVILYYCTVHCYIAVSLFIDTYNIHFNGTFP